MYFEESRFSQVAIAPCTTVHHRSQYTIENVHEESAMNSDVNQADDNFLSPVGIGKFFQVHIGTFEDVFDSKRYMIAQDCNAKTRM